MEARAAELDVWDYFLSRRQEFINPIMTTIDDSVGSGTHDFPRKARSGVGKVFGRQDEEMNVLLPPLSSYTYPTA